MDTLILAFKQIPWWVYPIFIFLILLGIQALKPRTVSLPQLFLMPLIFGLGSIWTLIARFQGFLDLVIWIFFLLIGYIAGIGLVHALKIQVDKKKLLIRLPSSSVVLVLVILLFFTKYCFGYRESLLLETANLIGTSLIAGMFIGRFLAIIKKIEKAKHTKLKKTPWFKSR